MLIWYMLIEKNTTTNTYFWRESNYLTETTTDISNLIVLEWVNKEIIYLSVKSIPWYSMTSIAIANHSLCSPGYNANYNHLTMTINCV